MSRIVFLVVSGLTFLLGSLTVSRLLSMNKSNSNSRCYCSSECKVESTGNCDMEYKVEFESDDEVRKEIEKTVREVEGRYWRQYGWYKKFKRKLERIRQRERANS